MRYRLSAAFLAATIAALPAHAQDVPKPITISGSAAVLSDYRLRGVSQSDRGFAVQGGITVTHESGFYVGTWGSNLAGWGTFGGANLELDAIGGFKKTFNGTTVDVGLTWYMYPGGAAKTDYAEPYVKLSHTLGPVSALAGVAYAPRQQALGRWYFTGASAQTGIPDRPFAKKDNLYVWTDLSAGVPNTKFTLRGHLGYSKGNKGLGPNGTSVAPTGEYLDWLLGVDYAVYGPITLSVAYVDTDISKRKAAYLLPNFATLDGKSISGSTALFSITAAF